MDEKEKKLHLEKFKKSTKHQEDYPSLLPFMRLLVTVSKRRCQFKVHQVLSITCKIYVCGFTKSCHQHSIKFQWEFHFMNIDVLMISHFLKFLYTRRYWRDSSIWKSNFKIRFSRLWHFKLRNINGHHLWDEMSDKENCQTKRRSEKMRQFFLLLPFSIFDRHLPLPNTALTLLYFIFSEYYSPQKPSLEL